MTTKRSTQTYNTLKHTSWSVTGPWSIPVVTTSQDLAVNMQASKPYISPTPNASLLCFTPSMSDLMRACHILQYCTRKSLDNVWEEQMQISISFRFTPTHIHSKNSWFGSMLMICLEHSYLLVAYYTFGHTIMSTIQSRRPEKKCEKKKNNNNNNIWGDPKIFIKTFSGGASPRSGSTITVVVCLKRSQCCGIRNLRGRRSIAYVADTLNLPEF